MTSLAEPGIAGYRDLELIAHGSSAFVYRAVQERLDRTVAIKVLLLDDVMTTEASVARELETTVAVSSHPHIVSIIDTGNTEAGQPYIVMEYCEGGSYSQILKAGGPLPVDDVVDVGIKIGEALHAAHAAGILHRDVKPQNILRTRFGPALTDFGIARAANELSSTATLDKLTPLHASPEALRRDEQHVTSDVYSLASSMWHLLGGHAPFANPGGGTGPEEFRQRLEHLPPPPLPRDDVPGWLAAELTRALAKAPGERHGTAAEFAEQLKHHSYGHTESGKVGTAAVASTVTDLSGEETVFVPDPPSTPANSEPLDPFAPLTPEASAPMAPPQSNWPASISAPPVSAQPVSAQPTSAQPTSAQPVSAPFGPHQQRGPEMAPPPAPFAAPARVIQPPVVITPTAAGAPRPAKDGGLLPYVITGSVIAVVLGIVVAILFVMLPGEESDSPGDPVDRADTAGGGAPTDVTLTDEGTSVTLQWTDPTDQGSLSFVVMGYRPGEQAELMGEVSPGDTATTINGLNADENYCFMIGALYSTDEVPMSDPVCTSR